MKKIFDNFYGIHTIDYMGNKKFWPVIMVKLLVKFSMIGLACNYSLAFAGSNDKTVEKTSSAGDKFSTNDASVVKDINNYLSEQLKSLSSFVQSVKTSVPEVKTSNGLGSFLLPSSKELFSKNKVSKVFEMGMNMPISPKISWGAEISISKYKSVFEAESKLKRPSNRFRLKPDLYSFQLGLKYKI